MLLGMGVEKTRHEIKDTDSDRFLDQQLRCFSYYESSGGDTTFWHLKFLHFLSYLNLVQNLQIESDEKDKEGRQSKVKFIRLQKQLGSGSIGHF